MLEKVEKLNLQIGSQGTWIRWDLDSMNNEKGKEHTLVLTSPCHSPKYWNMELGIGKVTNSSKIHQT